MFSRDVLDALFPEGPFWQPATDDDYDKLLEGIAENSEAVRQDLEALGQLRNPWKTPILSDLEKEFAVTPSATATDYERRQRLAAEMFGKNTLPTNRNYPYETDFGILQAKLRAAGFDVYVYPNDPITDPAEFLDQAFQMTCGDILPSGNDAQCGEPDAFCARIGGELLVNGEQYEQAPNFTIQCDEALAQCGETDALAGQFDSIRLIPVEYQIPTDSGYWPLIFFVGGERDQFPSFSYGANAPVQDFAIQSDDKIIMVGVFTTYNRQSYNRIVRINADGSIDTSFNIGTGASSSINAVAIQSDGKIIIGGAFTSYNGYPCNYLARLNTDGSFDDTFDTTIGAGNTVYTVAIQTDDKIIIGGFFTTYDGVSRNRIARVDTDGSLDATFAPGTGTNSSVFDVKIQTDGKILIGGQFINYNGTSRNRIARINTDGSLDGTFAPGTGADDRVDIIAIQTDGKILIGGYFNNYNATSRNYIARINTDGSLDGTFDTSVGANAYILAIAIQTDGKILIGGNFTSYNGTSINRIARLETDSSIDTSFDVGSGCNGYIVDITIQTDGKILIGGNFSYYNSLLRYDIARINTDGSNDDLGYSLSIASANIPIERRLEFRRLILKYKPLFSWAGLIVVYS